MANELELLIKARDTASATLGKVDKNLNVMSNTLKRARIAMVAFGTAVSAALVLSMKQFVDTGDQLDKLAAKTGYSVERLSELKYAAEISGASIGDLEISARGLSKAISDAGLGLKTAQDGFRMVGLRVEELKGLAPEDQFMAVASAINQVADQNTKAAAAMTLFGRSGTQLLPMLSGDLETLKAKAHELGIVFTADTAKQAAALNDTFKELQTSIQGIGFALAQKVTGGGEFLTALSLAFRDIKGLLGGGGYTVYGAKPYFADPTTLARLYGINRLVIEGKMSMAEFNIEATRLRKALEDAAMQAATAGITKQLEQQRVAAEAVRANWEKASEAQIIWAAERGKYLSAEENIYEKIDALKEQADYWGILELDRKNQILIADQQLIAAAIEKKSQQELLTENLKLYGAMWQELNGEQRTAYEELVDEIRRVQAERLKEYYKKGWQTAGGYNLGGVDYTMALANRANLEGRVSRGEMTGEEANREMGQYPGMYGGAQPFQINTSVQIDGREIARAVSTVMGADVAGRAGMGG